MLSFWDTECAAFPTPVLALRTGALKAVFVITLHVQGNISVNGSEAYLPDGFTLDTALCADCCVTGFNGHSKDFAGEGFAFSR